MYVYIYILVQTPCPLELSQIFERDLLLAADDQRFFFFFNQGQFDCCQSHEVTDRVEWKTQVCDNCVS